MRRSQDGGFVDIYEMFLEKQDSEAGGSDGAEQLPINNRNGHSPVAGDSYQMLSSRANW